MVGFETVSDVVASISNSRYNHNRDPRIAREGYDYE